MADERNPEIETGPKQYTAKQMFDSASTIGQNVRVWGDGETNDDYLITDFSDLSAALTQAQDDFSQGDEGEIGGRMVIPKGLWLVDSQFDLQGGTRLSGQGVESTGLKASESFTDDAIIHWDDAQDIGFAHIDRLKIHGHKGNASCSGIKTDTTNGGDPRDMHIESIFATRCDKHGVYFNYAWGYRVDSLLVEACGDSLASGEGALQIGTPGEPVSGTQSYWDKVFVSANQSDFGMVCRGYRNQFGTVKVQTNELNGIVISGNYNTFGNLVLQDNNTTSTSNTDSIEISGHNNVIRGGYADGNNDCRMGLKISGDNNVVSNMKILDHTRTFQSADVYFSSGAVENVLANVTFEQLSDEGVRNLINGHGTNAGNPSSTGNWNGNAAYAQRMGAIVWDTSTTPETPWVVSRSGNWRAAEPVSGSYTGNGTTGRIINIGFQPSTVIIEGSDGTVYDIREGFSSAGVFGTNPSGDVSFHSSGFTVGDNGADADPNTDTETYNYWAAA